MKIKSDFILREVAGNNIIVPVGAASKCFNGMISVNRTGAYLFTLMSQKDMTKDELVNALIREYDVSAETADTDVSAFMKKLADAGICE